MFLYRIVLKIVTVKKRFVKVRKILAIIKVENTIDRVIDSEVQPISSCCGFLRGLSDLFGIFIASELRLFKQIQNRPHRTHLREALRRAGTTEAWRTRRDVQTIRSNLSGCSYRVSPIYNGHLLETETHFNKGGEAWDYLKLIMLCSQFHDDNERSNHHDFQSFSIWSRVRVGAPHDPAFNPMLLPFRRIGKRLETTK